MEITNGFLLLNSFIARHISSEAVTSPPGESMRTITALIAVSFDTLRSIFTKGADSRPLSPPESASPRVMEPSPTTKATRSWLVTDESGTLT